MPLRHKSKKTQDRINKLLKAKCQGCGGCCTNSVVPVTHEDVKRIMKKTGQKVDDVVRLLDSSEIDYDHDSDAWIKFSYGKRSLALKKKNGHCQYLDDENRCMIYHYRPMTCRTFPHQVTMDEGKVQNITLNRMIKQSYPSGPKKSIDQLVKETKKEDRDDEKFFKLIEKFNKKKVRKGKKQFLKFLGFEV